MYTIEHPAPPLSEGYVKAAVMAFRRHGGHIIKLREQRTPQRDGVRIWFGEFQSHEKKAVAGPKSGAHHR